MQKEQQFQPGDTVKLAEADGPIMTVVAYTIDYLSISLEALESALSQMPVQELVKCEWKTPAGDIKQDVFREDTLERVLPE